MDFIKKNKFWIASFVLVAGMVGTWFYASSTLDAATKKRVSDIKSAIQKMVTVGNVSAEEGQRAHPNRSTEDGMKAKLETLSDSVLAAWQLRFDSQQEIMQWPASLSGTSGDAFKAQFDQWSPPEILPLEQKGQSENMRTLLQVYKQQIPTQMDDICAIIHTNWLYQKELAAQAVKGADDDEEAPAAPDSAPSDDDDDEEDEDDEEDKIREIVQWNEINQDLWYRKLTSFKGRDDNEFTTRNPAPSPSQALMLQQDLWLLEAMFHIIRNVNAQLDENGNPIIGPDGEPVMVKANDLAVVKVIDHVVFGREALSLLGEITDTISDAPAQSGIGVGVRGGGRPGARGKSQSEASDLNLAYLGEPAFHGRYVNANLEPIEAATVRKVLTGKELPKDNPELVVAKRVPVRIAVVMDERKIPDFLAASANSPFAFEVWQVRINKHDSEEVIKLRGNEGGDSGTLGSRGGGGRPGGGRSGPGGRPGIGGLGAAGGASGLAGGGTGAGGGRKKTGKIEIRQNYDLPVEFYGIIKIYNPVNEEMVKSATGATLAP